MSKVSGHEGGRALISDMQGWDIFKVSGNLINESEQMTYLEALSGNCRLILLASLLHLEVEKTIGVIHRVDIKIQTQSVRVVRKYQLGGMLVGNQGDYLVAQLG